MRGKDERKEDKGTSSQVFQILGQDPSVEVMRSISWISDSNFISGNRIEQYQNDQDASHALRVNIILEDFCFRFMYYLYDDLNSYCGPSKNLKI